MAISTSGVYLKYKGTGDAYETLVDIKAFPDMGAAPQTVETTTLSDTAQTFVMGVKTTVPMEFTANYDPDDYDKLIALSGEQEFALFFGENGENGIFAWTGELTVWIVGAGTNAAVDMKISIIPTSEVTKQTETV